MKHFITILALTVFPLISARAQGYESQYPYDPYSSTPQPHQSQSYQTQNGSGDGSFDSGYSGDYAKLLTYGYLDGHVAYNDFKGDSKLDGDAGFGVNLHVELMKPLFLHFGLDRITSEDVRGRDIDLTSFTAGGGFYIPFGSRFHLFGEIGFRYDDTSGDLSYLNPDDFALYARPGIRIAATDKLELSASVYFGNTDNFNNFVVEVAAYYALLSWLDIGGGVNFGDDVNSYQFGGRWRW